MGIIGKIAAVLTLILSGVAVYFSHELFLQREALKGRTQNLENAVRDIAKTIEISPESDERVPVPDQQLMDFQSMAGPLSALREAARQQRTRLVETRIELADTKDTLARTERELEPTKSDLAAARETIRQQKDTIAQRDNTISELNVTIEGLEADKNQLTLDLAEEKARSEEKDLEITSLEDKVADMQLKIEELEKLIKPEDQIAKLFQGDQGKVVYVNSDWNFVIFAAGDNIKHLAPELDFLVHRGEQYVGAIKISKVLLDEQLVIAEILSDRQKQAFQTGDTVIY